MFKFLIFIIAALACYYFYALIDNAWPFTGMALEDTGQFGDSWGAFTSIFSALGFCGVLWTIKLQREATQKIERDSRKREESERLRDFENSFFKILNILQTIINDVRVTNKKRDILSEGRGVFLYYFQGFSQELRKAGYKDFDFNKSSFTESFFAKKQMLRLYDSYFSSRTQNLSHYFRYLYNAFKFIDDSKMDDEIKRKYASLLRAQLSNYELVILFYNSLTYNGIKFQSYFTDYAVLDNLPVEKLLSKNQVVFVNKKCWGNNRPALSEYI